MNQAIVIEVIETDLTIRGNGTKECPTRAVKQYWTKAGELLAEDDQTYLAQAQRHLLDARNDIHELEQKLAGVLAEKAALAADLHEMTEQCARHKQQNNDLRKKLDMNERPAKAEVTA